MSQLLREDLNVNEVLHSENLRPEVCWEENIKPYDNEAYDNETLLKPTVVNAKECHS